MTWLIGLAVFAAAGLIVWGLVKLWRWCERFEARYQEHQHRFAMRVLRPIPVEETRGDTQAPPYIGEEETMQGKMNWLTDAAGDERWEAAAYVGATHESPIGSTCSDAGPEPTPIEASDLRASEGYRRKDDNRNGAMLTLRILLSRATFEALTVAEHAPRWGGEIQAYQGPDGRWRCAIFSGGNFETLAVQGPVDGFETYEELAAALNRATVTMLEAHINGEF